MSAIKLDKSKWSVFFDRMSQNVLGKRVEVEVAGIAVGDQIEAEWLPLLGITPTTARTTCCRWFSAGPTHTSIT